MQLQDTILNRLGEKYPEATLKKLSKLTGIQITRVFRIMNGYEMKLSEYEAIDSLLRESESTKEHSEHLNLYLKYLNLTSPLERSILEYKYERKVEFSKFILPHGILNNNICTPRSEFNA